MLVIKIPLTIKQLITKTNGMRATCIVGRERRISAMMKTLKFTLFLTLFLSAKVNGEVLAQSLNLSLKNVSIPKVLKEIRNQTNYELLYAEGIINQQKKVSINVSNANITEVLDICFPTDGNLEYVIDEKTIIIRRKTSFTPKVQQVDITGRVVSADGSPISGASVVIKGSSQGTSTDDSGNFRIESTQARVVLVISFIGFESKEVTISGSAPVTITLEPKSETSEEIVVIGYGTQKKVDVTGAISTIKAADLNQGINQSASHALQGRAAGVTVMQNSGAPGEGVEIRVRGAGSINDNSPLYVVDGIISGDINGLNPADIESISVLKDAASAAIYGSRGANGVVIVTTKKGRREQKTSISYNTSHGIQQAWRMPDALNAEERNLIHKEALTNDGTDPGDAVWNYYNDPQNAVTRTDWFKEVLKPAYISSHDLAIRGGSSRSNYSFSLGYLDNNGIVTGTNFKRYNVRINSQHELFKNLTFGENIYATVTDQKAGEFRGAYDGVLSSALFNFRNIPVYTDKANNIYGTPSGDFPNPVASLNSRDNRNKNLSLGGNAYLEYKFLGMFTAKTDFAYSLGYGKNKNFVAIAQGGGRGLNQKNSLSEYFTNGNTWIWNNTLTFDKNFGRHHVAALIGMSSEAGYSEWTTSGTANDFSNQDRALRYFNNAGSFPNHVGGSADDYSLVGYFGRVSYAFEDRYLLSANIRRDGSSKFAPQYRWGTFPSVSAGWRVSKEKFFEPISDVVSEFKVRGSWGQLGNDKIPNYQFYSTVGSVESPTLNGEAFTALAQSRMANTNIKWEVTTQTDIGIDLGFMSNRLIASVDYYNKKTTDILVRVPLVSSYGVNTAPFQNAGVVSNKGFEFSATFRDAGKGKLGYEVTANVATVKNKLETLGVTGANQIFTSDYKNTQVGRMAEGEALGHFYVLQSMGLFQTQAEVDSYVDKDGNKIQPNAVPGDIKFQDTNGDGVISADDRINAGNSFPQFTYSLNTSLNYGGFDMNMMWSGSHGNKIFNGLAVGGKLMQGAGYNNSVDILNRWMPNNTNTDIPRVSIKDLNGNNRYSTFYIEDGSFLRMKYLSFGYTFNNKKMGPNISKLRVFLTFQNLITITKYSGFDPEIGSDVGINANMYGVDRGAYPQAKAYILGVNFNF